MKHIFFLPFLMFLALPSLHAQSWQWAYQYGNYSAGPDNYYQEEMKQMKQDPNGNVYICGKLQGGAKWEGATNITSAYGVKTRGFVAKYDCDGNLLWRNLFGTNGSRVDRMMFDDSGNCYITGFFYYEYGPNNTQYTWINDSTFNRPTGVGSYYFASISPTGKIKRLVFAPFTPGSWTSVGLIDIQGHTLYGLGANYKLGVPESVYPNLPIIQPGSSQVIKFDTAFNPLSAVDLNSEGFDFKVAKNGDLQSAFTATDSTTVGGTTIPVPNVSNVGVLVRFDSLGTLKLLKTSTGGSLPGSPMLSGMADLQEDIWGDYYVRISGRNGFEYDGHVFNYVTTYNKITVGIMKMSHDGSLKWSIINDSITNTGDRSTLICLDKNHQNIVFLNSCVGNLRFGDLSIHTNGPGNIPYITRIDTGGTHVELIAQINTSRFSLANSPRGITSGEKGDIFVAGMIKDQYIFGTDTLQNSNIGGTYSYDLFLAKYGYSCADSNGLISPLQAQSLVATAATSQSIDVTWQDISNVEWGYKLYRSPNGTTGWTPIATLIANTTSYNDNGLNPNTVYYYKVASYNNIGESFSNSDSAKTNTTAVTEPFRGNISLFPNPNKGAFRLNIEVPTDQKADFLLHDLAGKQVYAQALDLKAGSNSVAMILVQLPTGVYIAEVRTPKGNWKEKVVKE